MMSSPGASADLRTSLLILARAAERAERWEDLCRCMKELVKLTPLTQPQTPDSTDLTDEERHLFALGFKQTIGTQRNAWKTMRSVTTTATSSPVSFTELAEDYKQQIEKELHLSCSELIQLLETILIKQVQRPESKVYYMKMCGDHYRYLCDVIQSRAGFNQPCPGGFDKKAHEYYTSAYKLALNALPSNHPTRLAASLNLAVCLHEIVRDRKGACDVAKSAFDSAIVKLEELDEQKYKDATLIMQLLRDNLTLWTSLQQQQQQHPGHLQ